MKHDGTQRQKKTSSKQVLGRDSEMAEKKVCEFVEGDCVGELEFINNHKCVADVKAKGNVRTAKMHRHHFEMCMGPIVDILRRQADTGEVYEYYRQVWLSTKKISAEKGKKTKKNKTNKTDTRWQQRSSNIDRRNTSRCKEIIISLVWKDVAFSVQK